MCLIIQKPAGQVIPDYVLKSARRKNPDGAGIMHSGTAEKWTDIKTENLFAKIDELKDVDVGIHFRYATHGKVNRKNCHPFKLHNNGWLMHNGVIHKYTPSKWLDGDKSDTVLFIERWINPLLRKEGTVPAEKVNAEAPGNAFLYMSENGTFAKVGSGWTEHKGVWLSNNYAWDYDGKYSYGRISSFGDPRNYTGYSTWVTTPNKSVVVDDVDVDDDVDDQWEACGEIGVHVYDYLDAYVDDLDLTQCFPHAADESTFDRVLAGQLDVHTFITMARPETVLDMFMKLCHEHRLPSIAFYR